MTRTVHLQPGDRVSSEYGNGVVEIHTVRHLVYRLDNGEPINVVTGTPGYYRVQPETLPAGQLPTVPGLVDGIVSVASPKVQCRGCGTIANGDPGKLALLVLTCGIIFHVADGRRTRLCVECRRGCTCHTCRR